MNSNTSSVMARTLVFPEMLPDESRWEEVVFPEVPNGNKWTVSATLAHAFTNAYYSMPNKDQLHAVTQYLNTKIDRINTRFMTLCRALTLHVGLTLAAIMTQLREFMDEETALMPYRPAEDVESIRRGLCVLTDHTREVINHVLKLLVKRYKTMADTLIMEIVDVANKPIPDTMPLKIHLLKLERACERFMALTEEERVLAIFAHCTYARLFVIRCGMTERTACKLNKEQKQFVKVLTRVTERRRKLTDAKS